MFKPKIFLTVITLFFIAINMAGCGENSGSTKVDNNNNTTSLISTQGSLSTALGDNPNDYKIVNSYENTTPDSSGTFKVVVSETTPTLTYALSSTGNKVYAALTTSAPGSLTIDAQSTAEALVLLSPLLIPRSSEEYSTIVNTVKSDNAVKSLASVIETVYSSVEDPLSDERILNATAEAVKSVLSVLQETGILQKTKSHKTKPYTLQFKAMGYRSLLNVSSMQIFSYDMGALTLENSSASTLKLEIADAGPGGIKTNVDWVAKIIELDPAKIQWVNNTFLFNPDYLDNLIKDNGYQQKIIVEGEIASGLLGWTVDPLGKVADLISGVLFPDQGITLDDNGVYAVVAFSGSPYGDSIEYSAIINSEWQKELWKEALSINIVLAALDIMGTATSIAGIDMSPVLEEQVVFLKAAITDNPENVGIEFIVEKTADVSDNLLDYARPYIHSAISDLQQTGFKKFFHVAINTVKSVADVWSGTISASTRIGNFLFSVTPRESGYGILGNSPLSDTTALSTPTGVIATPGNGQVTIIWNTVSSATSYNIYWSTTSDVSKTSYSDKITNITTASYTHTGLTNNTTYYYIVTAANAYGESSESSQVSATPQTPGTAPSTPTSVSATANDGQVTLSWNSASGATSYNIYYSTTSGVRKTTGTQISGVTSPYTHTDLTNGTTYYYVVTAANSYGESAESNEVSAKPQVSTILPWAKTYGGTNDDSAYSIQQTSDGGYIVAGYTKSFGAGGYDFWILKLDGGGNVAWQKTYGGIGDDSAYSIQQTSDGGYVVAGSTHSFGYSIFYSNVWILKLDGNGNITWQKTYGGTNDDSTYSIQQTSDGGYIVAGHSNYYFWILKLDGNGNITWQKEYWGISDAYDIDVANSIQQTSDGGYVVAGETASFGAGSADFWILKLDGNGNITWQKTYGGISYDSASSIQQTSDGGYVVAGETASFGAGYSIGYSNVWILKLDGNGNITWQKTYGGTNDDSTNSIQQTSDGGYIVAGETRSFGEGFSDFWILKLDSSGNITWQRTYGGTDIEDASSIQQTSDGGYIVAGYTFSFGVSGPDFWILKLNSDGTINFNPSSGASTTDTSVSGLNTSVTGANTNATIINTSVTGASTDVTSTNTNAIINQQTP